MNGSRTLRLAPRCDDGSDISPAALAGNSTPLCCRTAPETADQSGKLRALARQGRTRSVFSAHDEIHRDADCASTIALGRGVGEK